MTTKPIQPGTPWPHPAAAQHLLQQLVEDRRPLVRRAAALARTLEHAVPRAELGTVRAPLGSPAVAHVALRRYLRRTGGVPMHMHLAGGDD